jgi:intron-binding protein aquarius
MWASGATESLESTFFPALLTDFLTLLASTRSDASYGSTAAEAAVIQYCCRLLVLLVDVLAQLPTRRFVRVLLEDMHIFTQCRLSRTVDLLLLCSLCMHVCGEVCLER